MSPGVKCGYSSGERSGPATVTSSVELDPASPPEGATLGRGPGLPNGRRPNGAGGRARDAGASPAAFDPSPPQPVWGQVTLTPLAARRSLVAEQDRVALVVRHARVYREALEAGGDTGADTPACCLQRRTGPAGLPMGAEPAVGLVIAVVHMLMQMLVSTPGAVRVHMRVPARRGPVGLLRLLLLPLPARVDHLMIWRRGVRVQLAVRQLLRAHLGSLGSWSTTAGSSSLPSPSGRDLPARREQLRQDRDRLRALGAALCDGHQPAVPAVRVALALRQHGVHDRNRVGLLLRRRRDESA